MNGGQAMMDRTSKAMRQVTLAVFDRHLPEYGRSLSRWGFFQSGRHGRVMSLAEDRRVVKYTSLAFHFHFPYSLIKSRVLLTF